MSGKKTKINIMVNWKCVCACECTWKCIALIGLASWWKMMCNEGHCNNSVVEHLDMLSKGLYKPRIIVLKYMWVESRPHALYFLLYVFLLVCISGFEICAILTFWKLAKWECVPVLYRNIVLHAAQCHAAMPVSNNAVSWREDICVSCLISTFSGMVTNMAKTLVLLGTDKF